MAGQSSQEKTEQATPKKLREARKKGQVAKSRDLSMVFVMIAFFGVFAVSTPFFYSIITSFFEKAFNSISEPTITNSLLVDLGIDAVLTIAKVLIPLFLAGMAIALLVGGAQVGAMFSTEVLKPKFEKLNPVQGLKNMFKVKTLIELVKNSIKIALVLYLAYDTFSDKIDDLLKSPLHGFEHIALVTGKLVIVFIVKVSICFVVLSLIDYAIQRWDFMKEMRMTKEEVKKEYKEDEGDPTIKRERKRIHREMAFGDAKQAVKKSSVVVTNPVHIACALEYSEKEMGAPVLAIKGQNKYAEMIIEIARQEEVTIMRNVPLAWSLLNLEEGDEIPEELYEAVADILTVVYQMKEKKEQEEAQKKELTNAPGLIA